MMKRFLALVLMLSSVSLCFCVQLTSDQWNANTEKKETTTANLQLSISEMQYYEFGFTRNKTVGDVVTPIDGIEFGPEVENTGDGGVRIFAEQIDDINIYWKAIGPTSFKLRLKASGPLTGVSAVENGKPYEIGWSVSWDNGSHNLGSKNSNVYSTEDDTSIVKTRNFQESTQLEDSGLLGLTIAVDDIDIAANESFPPFEEYSATLTLVAEGL